MFSLRLNGPERSGSPTLCARCWRVDREVPGTVSDGDGDGLDRILAPNNRRSDIILGDRRTRLSVWCGHEDPCCPPVDRKSTRLNSSHVAISYAVFCLKKKN